LAATACEMWETFLNERNEKCFKKARNIFPFVRFFTSSKTFLGFHGKKMPKPPRNIQTKKPLLCFIEFMNEFNVDVTF